MYFSGRTSHGRAVIGVLNTQKARKNINTRLCIITVHFTPIGKVIYQFGPTWANMVTVMVSGFLYDRERCIIQLKLETTIQVLQLTVVFTVCLSTLWWPVPTLPSSMSLWNASGMNWCQASILILSLDSLWSSLMLHGSTVVWISFEFATPSTSPARQANHGNVVVS